MNALILRSRFEFKNPKGKLGITGPAGSGKTQFAYTLAARLSRHVKVSLYTNDKFAPERLRELGANLSNIILGPGGELMIVDDLQAFIEGVPKYKLARFLFESIRPPALVISQIRLNDIPAIPIPRIRRYLVDERVEFDGSKAYRRLLKRKIELLEYELGPEGFKVSYWSSLRSRSGS